MWAHPHVRGENLPGMVFRAAFAGSSPRVRGKHTGIAFFIWIDGLIPARAGKTFRRVPYPTPNRAHPRACGENHWLASLEPLAMGSSPRVRGKRRFRGRLDLVAGLIPACAGKTGALIGVWACAHGSSPRVRGKRSTLSVLLLGMRLIPACAGKTTSLWRAIFNIPAHPRMCGENTFLGQSVKAAPGSSPHVRGKPQSPPCQHHPQGLIPACAGKTCKYWKSY